MSRYDRRMKREGTSEQKEALTEFRRVHRRLSRRVERFLMQAIILTLVTLVLVQAVQTNGFIRRHLPFTPAEALEGIPTSEVLAWSDTYGAERTHLTSRPVVAGAAGDAYTVVVTSMETKAPGVQLLVDGAPVGDFSTGQVQVDVRPGQQIDIDARGVGIPLYFRVTGNGDLRAPSLGQEVSARGNVVSLGVVRER